MPKVLLRPKEIERRLGCGHSRLYTDYLEREGEPYVPGTNIRRLPVVRIGPNSVAALEQHVDRLIDDLIAAQAFERPPTPHGRDTATARPRARPRIEQNPQE